MILITGAGGFFGQALGRVLIDAGRTVLGVDLSDQGQLPFRCIALDLLDARALDSICRSHAIDAIVHAGGVSGRSVNRHDPAGVLTTNIAGTTHVFEAARRHGIKRVVLCSSGSVYGRSTDDPVTEGTSTIPINAYGASKVAAEAVLHAYAEDGVDGLALRVFNAYGPGRRTACTMRELISAGIEKRVAKPMFEGRARFQFVYITDVVDALRRALDVKNPPQRVYNVTGRCSLTLSEVAEVVGRVFPDLKVEFPQGAANGEYALSTIDISAAERDFGYVPRVGLDEGIVRFARHLRGERQSWGAQESRTA